MTHPPLKRHAALQPLSREHMGGLIQSRNLQHAAAASPAERAAAAAAFHRVWVVEIADHFDDEERLLLPLTHRAEDRDRLLDEHAKIRAMAAELFAAPDNPAPSLLTRLGVTLHDHIRWEERVYFQHIQDDADPAALNAVEPHADQVMHKRPGSRPRRHLDGRDDGPSA